MISLYAILGYNTFKGMGYSMRYTNDFKDYELLDCGDFEKLERYKDVTLLRPEPSALWLPSKPWPSVDGHFIREKGQSKWHFNRKLPDSWTINYKSLTFKVSPTDFKHTGLFPEQAVNWNWLHKIISDCDEEVSVLNLFGYTGAATMVCAQAGAVEVVHVDALKSVVNWAKENAQLSGLNEHMIRYIVDDVMKFVQREKRRGRKYHGIIMDPPSFGRGPKGEQWKIEQQLMPLLEACLDILVNKPLFLLINTYTTALSAPIIHNIMTSTVMKRLGHGVIDCDDIGIPVTDSDLVLPCGVSARWARDQHSL